MLRFVGTQRIKNVSCRLKEMDYTSYKKQRRSHYFSTRRYGRHDWFIRKGSRIRIVMNYKEALVKFPVFKVIKCGNSHITYLHFHISKIMIFCILSVVS